MLNTITQLDQEGNIVLNSLPEPLRTKMIALARDRTIDWLVDGDDHAISFGSFWILCHWAGLDIESKH